MPRSTRRLRLSVRIRGSHPKSSGARVTVVRHRSRYEQETSRFAFAGRSARILEQHLLLATDFRDCDVDGHAFAVHLDFPES